MPLPPPDPAVLEEAWRRAVLAPECRGERSKVDELYRGLARSSCSPTSFSPNVSPVLIACGDDGPRIRMHGRCGHVECHVKKVAWLALLAAGLGLLSSTRAVLAQPLAGSFLVRGSIGLATQSMSDWRQGLDEQKQAFASAGVPAKWENIGTAFNPGLEVGYMITDLVSMGAFVNYQKGSSKNAYADFSGSISQDIGVSMTSFGANVSFWPASGRGLFVGGSGGIGFGKAADELHFQDYSNSANNFDATGKWDGSGFVGSLFLGFQHQVANAGFMAKTWYQFANLGVFDGTVTSPQGGFASGPPTDSNGQPMDTDFSGVGLAIGVGLVLGSPR